MTWILSDQRIPFLPSTANSNMVTKMTFGIFLRSFLITPRFCGCVREEREKLEEPFPHSFPPPPPSAAANQTRNSTFIFRDCSFHSNIQMKRLFPTPESPLPFTGLGKSRFSIVKHSMNLALPIDFQEMLRSTSHVGIQYPPNLHCISRAMLISPHLSPPPSSNFCLWDKKDFPFRPSVPPSVCRT